MLSSKICISNDVILVLTFSNLSRMLSHCWHWSVCVKNRYCGLCSLRPSSQGNLQHCNRISAVDSSPPHPCLLGSQRPPQASLPHHCVPSSNSCGHHLLNHRLHLPKDQEGFWRFLSTLSVPPNPIIKVVPRATT